MSSSTRARISTALVCLAVGLVVRLAFVELSHVGPLDLDRFEDTYGVSLEAWYDDVPYFLHWTLGDGQAFVALAIDPLLDGPATNLSQPSYRFTRVGFSLLGRAAVGWNADLIPVGLFALNTLALLATGWIAGPRIQQGKWLWMLVVFNPAIHIGFAGDSAEPLGCLLLLLVLTAKRGAPAFAMVLATVRPSYLTVIPARDTQWLHSAVPAATAALLVRLLSDRLVPFVNGEVLAQFTWPLGGYATVLSSMSVPAVLGTLGLVTGAILTVVFGIRVRHWPTAISWVVTGLLVLCFSELVTASPVNSLRAAGALPLLWAASHRASAA